MATMIDLNEQVNETTIGCWIDGSHCSALELDYRLISLAHSYGYDVNIDQLNSDLAMFDDLTYEEQADIQEGAWEESGLALDWLNSQLIDPRFTFFIDDNSLYLEFDDLEGAEYNV